MTRTTLIVPCSGIGKTYGTVAREGGFIVTEDLCPESTRLVPLSLVVLGDEAVRDALGTSPAITIDGCKLACAAKVVAESGGTVARALQVLDVYRRNRHLKPAGIAELNEAGHELASVLAEEVSDLVDRVAAEEENA
jgi:uncharacterized metal-binding protein